jgi:hypothetical protein
VGVGAGGVPQTLFLASVLRKATEHKCQLEAPIFFSHVCLAVEANILFPLNSLAQVYICPAWQRWKRKGRSRTGLCPTRLPFSEITFLLLESDLDIIFGRSSSDGDSSSCVGAEEYLPDSPRTSFRNTAVPAGKQLEIASSPSPSSQEGGGGGGGGERRGERRGCRGQLDLEEEQEGGQASHPFHQPARASFQAPLHSRYRNGHTLQAQEHGKQNSTIDYHGTQLGYSYRDSRGLGVEAYRPMQGFNRLHGFAHQFTPRGQRNEGASGRLHMPGGDALTRPQPCVHSLARRSLARRACVHACTTACVMGRRVQPGLYLAC